MDRPMDLPPASMAPRLAASMMPGPPPEQTTKRRGRGPSVKRPSGNLVRELARFLVIAGHFEKAFGVAHFATVLCLGSGGKFFDVFVFQPRAARLRGFVRFDARRTEHDDGVADALALELRERMQILGQDAERPSGRALKKRGIFVRRFGGVLRLELEAVLRTWVFLSERCKPPL